MPENRLTAWTRTRAFLLGRCSACGIMADRYYRRFVVKGVDRDGDVQAFHTNSAEAAESVRRQMEDDLSDVDVLDQEARSGD